MAVIVVVCSYYLKDREENFITLIIESVFHRGAGKHTLKVWLIDTGVYFERFMLDFGGLKESYLGPNSW